MTSPSRIGRKELERVLNVSPRTITNWLAEGCPHRMKGRSPQFVVAEVVEWRIRKAERATQVTSEADARRDKLAAEAERARLEVEQLKGTLVTIDDMEREVRSIVEDVAASLKAMAGSLAGRLEGSSSLQERAVVIEDAIADTIVRLRAAGDRSAEGAPA